MAGFIEHLHELPIDSLTALVTESEEAGSRIVRRLVEEWVSGVNRFDRPGEALFGMWVDGRLVGVCGLNIDPYSGDEQVGRLRHLYVLTAYRRLGVGRRLVAEVIGTARAAFATLRLSTTNPAAARLYEDLGFRSTEGAVKDATHIMPLAPGNPSGVTIRTTT